MPNQFNKFNFLLQNIAVLILAHYFLISRDYTELLAMKVLENRTQTASASNWIHAVSFCLCVNCSSFVVVDTLSSGLWGIQCHVLQYYTLLCNIMSLQARLNPDAKRRVRDHGQDARKGNVHVAENPMYSWQLIACYCDSHCQRDISPIGPP